MKKIGVEGLGGQRKETRIKVTNKKAQSRKESSTQALGVLESTILTGPCGIDRIEAARAGVMICVRSHPRGLFQIMR